VTISAGRVGLALCALWLGVVGWMASSSNDWRIGRYANTFEGDYAVHCWKTYDVEHGKEKVDACIARQLSQDENDRMWQQTIGSYVSSAWKRLAIVLSVPLLIFGFLATWSLLQRTRTPMTGSEKLKLKG